MKVKVFDNSGFVCLPEYATKGSAGLDLRASLRTEREDEPNVFDAYDVTIPPNNRVLVKTGLFMEIPVGFEAQVRPRSGLALKNGITVLNSPGTIDSDYRGEVGVILVNHGSEDFHIKHGDRIAQLVFAPVVQAEWEYAPSIESLQATERGTGGFGSTGVTGSNTPPESKL